MKYVIIKSHNLCHPIIFDDHITHSSVIPTITEMNGSRKVVSAGFVYFETLENKFKCFGKSESLHIKSKPEQDTLFVNTWFSFGGAMLVLSSLDYLESIGELTT